MKLLLAALCLAIGLAASGAFAGDMRYTNKLIAKFAESDDPIERAAAVAARDLTPDGFNDVGKP